MKEILIVIFVLSLLGILFWIPFIAFLTAIYHLFKKEKPNKNKQYSIKQGKECKPENEN